MCQGLLAEKKSEVNGHLDKLALPFYIGVTKRQCKLPAMYWLPKLHKRPYKQDLF